jgi:putative heme-binding domain-containing protein
VPVNAREWRRGAAAAWATLVAIVMAGAASAADPVSARGFFAPQRLAAWCIVPFDDEERTPAERVALLGRLGIGRYAYDYRARHVPQFEEEMRAVKGAGIELVGWWFPGALDDEARTILGVLERVGLCTSLWVTGGGGPTASAEQQAARVAAEAARIEPLARAAARIGCRVGLYNHGGWFGEPENQIAIIRTLSAQGIDNVGIVYNQHHGHAHVGRWRELLAAMLPHLDCLNLNGTFTDGETRGLKIAPIGQGDLDLDLLRTVVESGYRGPIGILNHTQEDAEDRLRDNLAGLAYVARRIDGDAEAERPVPMTWQRPPEADSAAVTPAAAALAAAARLQGDPGRGSAIFARAELACLSCHEVAGHGGRIGPALGRVGAERSAEQIAEALLEPQRVVEPRYRAVALVLADGTSRRGTVERETDALLAIRDVQTGGVTELSRDVIESCADVGSLMPAEVVAALGDGDRADLVAFLADLGRHQRLPAAAVAGAIAAAHPTKPAPFAPPREPLDTGAFAAWSHPVNRDRIYDYYAKEARHFRALCPRPTLLPAFPGLDGGALGHWGNQTEDTWRSNRWNEVVPGSLQAGVLQGFGLSIPRAVCVRLSAGLSACFDPDTLTWRAAWSGGFVRYSDERHGFLGGMVPAGPRVELPSQEPPRGETLYQGFCRQGDRVGFLYSVDGVPWLDVAEDVGAGTFARLAGPVAGHPRAALLAGGGPQWPDVMVTAGQRGEGRPWAVDTLSFPEANPWNAAFYCGDVDVVADGALVVCTIYGDVWRVDGVDDALASLRWRRIAAGLHQPLGMVVVDGVPHVLGRDQITRLVDVDGDGETDRYECFSRAYHCSPGGHDYVCGLVRDAAGRFLTASSVDGLVRIAADGRSAEVLATGLRNPDGVGVYPDGTATASSSEGDWVPATTIAAVPPDAWGPLHFGAHGPAGGTRVDPPLLYLPRGLDNSAGGQAWIPDGALGPLGGTLFHTSFGAGTALAILRDRVGDVLQGGAVPLPVEFRSGSHRARFNAFDGAVYVCGMTGWGTYTPDVGCLQRVRFTGHADGSVVQMPVGFHLHDNGVLLRFAAPLDPAVAADPARHFAQAWNYRYSGGYGSAEYSPRHDGMVGHDHLPIRTALPTADGRGLFVEIPDIRPVGQLHLAVESAPGLLHDLFLTANRLDASFVAPGIGARTTPVPAHPLAVDLGRRLARERNPFCGAIEGAREIEIQVGPNLSFVPRSLHARPGEVLAVSLVNPDSVPHNWALVRPGTLDGVGAAVDRLVTDPDAVARHYVPKTDDIVAYTDVVPPNDRERISFRVPTEPGRYPFLCTFPGHWRAMNGEIVVTAEEAGRR